MNQTVYFTTRRCITGANEYRYFNGVKPLGEASAFVMRLSSISIRGTAITMQCEQDMDRTVFPGARNVVINAHTGEAVASSVWLETGCHALYLDNVKVDVVVKDGIYHFSRQGTPLAVMARSPRGKSSPHTDDQWESEFVMMAPQPLSDRLALLMLAFPLIQVAP